MSAPRASSSIADLGWLALLALPFAAVGTFMAYLTLHTLFALMLMLGWPTVPATLQTVELKAGSGSGATSKAVASYTYVVDGRRYTGTRVSVYGFDNLGDFHQRAFAELHDALARQAPYPVHVDPRAPTESILMPVLRWEAVGFYLVLAVVFGGAGWGILIASYLGARRRRMEAALVRQYPNQPWKQRVEWSGARITSSQRSDAVVQTCMAVFWNATTFPVLLIIPREVGNGRYVALTFLVCPLIGVGLLSWAFVALARAKRFGRVYLELDTMPGRPSEPLRGCIYAPKALGAVPDVAVGLRCERQYAVSIANKGTTTKSEVLWKVDSRTPVLRGQTSTGDVMLAVAIEIPDGLPDSSRGAGDDYGWLLSARAPLAGADFAVEFEVPVFKR